MKDIPDYDQFMNIIPIHKGWSRDKKYRVETKSGKKLLLRISDISALEEKRREFELMRQMAATGIKMSEPIDFGVCDEGQSVYQLLTWIEGDEAKELLPSLSEQEQYAYGWQAGRMMLKMQTAESYPPSSEWASVYGQKVKQYIEAYKSCGE